VPRVDQRSRPAIFKKQECENVCMYDGCVYVFMCGFCNVWVCVCVGFVMCGCLYVWVFWQLYGYFGNMCTCIDCVFVFFR
jgi:hypothetical protein